MICAYCGGVVEWQGPASMMSHTKCLDCGRLNCQEDEGDGDDEYNYLEDQDMGDQ